MNRIKPNKLAAVAYHEAGHAVAYLIQGIPIESATIIASDDYLGLVSLDKKMSGPLLRFVGIHTEEDTEYEQKLMEAFENDQEVDIPEPEVITEADFDKHIIGSYAGVIVEKMFTGKNNNRGAESDYNTIVNLVLARFGDTKLVNAYLKYIRLRTEQLITANWKKVETVAQELLNKKTMTAEQIQQSIQQAIEKQIGGKN